MRASTSTPCDERGGRRAGTSYSTINNLKLNALKAPLHTWQAHVYGQVSPKDFPTADILDFKKGSQIMMVANDGEQRWANGTLAVIEDIFLDNGKAGPDVKVKVVGKTSPLHCMIQLCHLEHKQ